jgi:hypothetical protein
MTADLLLSGADTPTLKSVRRMLEGVIPLSICSVSADGIPHVSYVSTAEYVDESHIALSYQFFNRSRENILASRRVAMSVEDPYTGGAVIMRLEYLRTDIDGGIFERLRARLAGIASHCGMAKVFRLQGADVYRVHEVRRVPGRRELKAAEPRCDVLTAARVVADSLGQCKDLDQTFEAVMAGLRDQLLVRHAMLLLIDRQREVFYTAASLGYAESGIGTELPLDQGLAAVAVQEGVPLRIGHMTTMTLYGKAARARTSALGLQGVLEEEISLPGLELPRSQLAMPLQVLGETVGALLVESDQEQFFSYDDEDALSMITGPLAFAIQLFRNRMEGAQQLARPQLPVVAEAPSMAGCAGGTPLRVRRFARDQSIWFDNDYLIKGVAGSILWKLLDDWQSGGQELFTNRELRQTPELGLPDLQDNLEVRLLLLRRRLDEREAKVRIVKEGRGRWRLRVDQPITLESA